MFVTDAQSSSFFTLCEKEDSTDESGVKVAEEGLKFFDFFH